MKLKSEKGSITVYVLVAMFFLLAIIAGRFVIANRNLKVQYDALAKVKDIYESNDKIYEETTDDNGNTIVQPTNPTHEIYIFNKDAFNFFSNDGSSTDTRFYVYQVGLYYIFDESARKESTDVLIEDSIGTTDEENDGKIKFSYKLMSDITLSVDSNTVLRKKIMDNLDFNNHLIFTSNSNNKYVFFDTGIERPNSGTIGRW